MIQKYIITGGPGSGKSSILNELVTRGYNCSPEASREVIKQQKALLTNCLPWIDLECFADKVFNKMVTNYQNSAPDLVTFFDRGIPDIVAYLDNANLFVKDIYRDSLSKCIYNKNVFILPPWPQIYEQDEERWQTFDESVSLYENLNIVYKSFGFNLIEIPIGEIAQRADFLTEKLLSF